MSLKHLLVLPLVLALSPIALAQDEPTDDPIMKGGKSTPPDTPTSAPQAPPENKDSAPWSWPWGGSVRSPGWTQDENWANTHFWLMDVGHVQLEGIWAGTVERRSYDVDQLFEAKARIGLLPHIELSISEDATLLSHDHLRQEGNEIGARFSPFDYGTFPLNPAIEVVWFPRHNAPDMYQARGTLGGELFKGFFIVGNALFQGETGGIHDYTWGFRGGVAYELLHEVLRVGCEGGVTWDWNSDHDKTPFRDTIPTVGPTVLFRPLALLDPKWGNYAKLTVSAEFGIRDDNTNVPFMVGTAVFSFGF